MTITRTCLIVGVLFLLSAGPTSADQNDARLDELFLTVRQTDSPEVARSAENNIWAIWVQHNNTQIQQRMTDGITAMENNPDNALAIFNKLVEDVPNFAEAWNKRATLLYLLGEYAASLKDIEKTLLLEPRHFGALSGLGLVYLAQEQYAKARSAFEAVLLIHPHSSGARRNIELINEYIRRNTVFSIRDDIQVPDPFPGYSSGR